MLSEDFFAAVSGPPLASNTAVAKDVGIYHYALSPSVSTKATFKKSAAPPGAVAVSDAHVFAAQQDRAYVHVHSRRRGGQEAVVPIPEKVRCVALAGDVLVAGTAEGRLFLWETLTGRLIATPPCHVQAVSCLATTPYHVLSGSEDANVHVWSLPQLLALSGGGLDATAAAADEPEPERTLARHRAAVTSLAVGGGTSRDTNLCASASHDKSVVLWNYQTGTALRTLLFPAAASLPCLVLDPAARALYVAATEDGPAAAAAAAAKRANAPNGSHAAAAAATASGQLYAVELFGDKPLLGARSEAASTAVSIATPFATVPDDAGGPATCLAVSYDGATLLSGHPGGRILQWNLGDPAAGTASMLPTELARLNNAVTNLVFVPPLPAHDMDAATAAAAASAHTVVKPSQAGREYAVTVRFDEPASVGGDSDDLDDGLQYGSSVAASFDALLHQPGFPPAALDQAIAAFQQQLQQQQQQQQAADSHARGSSATNGSTTTTATGTAAAADAASNGDLARLRKQNEELLEIVNEQQELYQEALRRLAAKPTAPAA